MFENSYNPSEFLPSNPIFLTLWFHIYIYYIVKVIRLDWQS